MGPIGFDRPERYFCFITRGELTSPNQEMDGSLSSIEIVSSEIDLAPSLFSQAVIVGRSCSHGYIGLVTIG